MQENILTPEQVAKILQVHQFTVLKYIKQGKLKASKLGRVYRIRESDVEGFLDQTSGKSKQAGEELPNDIYKSKNKNKSLLNQQVTPTEQADATPEPKIPEPKIQVARIETIEASGQSSAQKGGEDQYYVLQ